MAVIMWPRFVMAVGSFPVTPFHSHYGKLHASPTKAYGTIAFAFSDS